MTLTGRLNVGSALTWLFSPLTTPITQACFCTAALHNEQEKPGSLWHHCAATRGDHEDRALRSRSELTVCDRSIRFTPGLHGRTRHDVVVHGQWTDTAVHAQCAPKAVLRFVFTPFRQAPYKTSMTSSDYVRAEVRGAGLLSPLDFDASSPHSGERVQVAAPFGSIITGYRRA